MSGSSASAPSLRTFTTMKIGGSPERLLFLSEFLSLPDFSQLPQPLRFLGNGSNILIDDRGLAGSVVVTREPRSNAEPIVRRSEAHFTEVEAPAGIFLPSLARWAENHGLSGCEYMIGIPGTLGGALVQNAGANGQELSDVFVSASGFKWKDQTLTKKDWLPEDAALGYRTSIFKSDPQSFITSVVLRLCPASAESISAQMEKNLAYRKSQTPYAKPSLGSIYTRIKKGDAWLYPGKLIEDAGLKGHSIGGAMVSPIHANYIVNEGSATFEDVIALMSEVERRVLQTSGIQLHREILVWSDR